MVLPLIFALVGILGGSYGIYQYFNNPKCEYCNCKLKFDKKNKYFYCPDCKITYRITSLPKKNNTR